MSASEDLDVLHPECWTARQMGADDAADDPRATDSDDVAELVEALRACLQPLRTPTLVTSGRRLLLSNPAASGAGAPAGGAVSPIVVLELRTVAYAARQRRARLPPRLRAVADLLVDGLAEKEIALRLSLSVWSVRTYVARVYRRLGVHSRVQLLRSLGVARPAPDGPREHRRSVASSREGPSPEASQPSRSSGTAVRLAESASLDIDGPRVATSPCSMLVVSGSRRR